MYKKLFAILTVSVLFGFTGSVLATSTIDSDTETDPYCERTRNGSPADYPGIGWYPEVVPADSQVGPATVMVCEGEHWDGQDSMHGDQFNTGDCTGQFVDANNDAYILAVNQCADPSNSSPFDLQNPVGVRVVAQGDGGSNAAENGAVYSAVRIGNVGQAVVFAGGCQKITNPDSQAFGNVGNADCQGELGHGVLGIYLQDDNVVPPDNNLARLVTIARLTKGFVADSDCGMEEYNRSAMATAAGQPATCGRDNTAISAELLV